MKETVFNFNTNQPVTVNKSPIPIKTTKQVVSP